MNEPRDHHRLRLPNGDPNPVDVHVGNRIHYRRLQLAITQEVLGNKIGLTFQQVQKYERGANRVGASRLFDLCRALDVKPNFFFEGLVGDSTSTAQTPPESIEAAKLLLTHAQVMRGLSNASRLVVHQVAKALAAASETKQAAE